jgi:hypothetical protein
MSEATTMFALFSQGDMIHTTHQSVLSSTTSYLRTSTTDAAILLSTTTTLPPADVCETTSGEGGVVDCNIDGEICCLSGDDVTCELASTCNSVGGSYSTFLSDGTDTNTGLYAGIVALASVLVIVIVVVAVVMSNRKRKQVGASNADGNTESSEPRENEVFVENDRQADIKKKSLAWSVMGAWAAKPDANTSSKEPILQGNTVATFDDNQVKKKQTTDASAITPATTHKKRHKKSGKSKQMKQQQQMIDQQQQQIQQLLQLHEQKHDYGENVSNTQKEECVIVTEIDENEKQPVTEINENEKQTDGDEIPSLPKSQEGESISEVDTATVNL